MSSRTFAASRRERSASVLLLALAVVLGLLAGWVDIHNDEVQAAVLVIVCATGALGMFAPRRAWIAGALVGLGVPIVHAIARSMNYPLPFAMDSYWESFIAVIPGVLGANIGATLRRAIATM